MKTPFLFALMLLFVSCKNVESLPSKCFFVVSIEDGILCSIKGNSNDTIFYENKFPNEKTSYSYSILSKQEKQILEKILQSYSKEKPLKNLNETKEKSIIILKSNQSKLYKIDWVSRNGKDLFNFVMTLEYKRKEIAKLKNFWNIDDFAPSIQKDYLKNVINSNGL